MTNSKPLLIRALRNEPLESHPVWIMRQAGRYLPEYRELRQKHGFHTMYTTPELAIEVSLQPLRRFPLDASIIFSDILSIFPGMGLDVEFNPGPKILNPLKSTADFSALRPCDIHLSCKFVLDAITGLKREVRKLDPEGNKAILGFSGAPWTLACYATEQGVYKHFQGTQVIASTLRTDFHKLLQFFTETVIDYLTAQAEAGADALQLFDTWAGNLSAADYREFALPYQQQIFTAIAKLGVPTVLYLNGTPHLLSEMAQSGADCLSIDWRMPLKEAHAEAPKHLALQGNFDPTWLFRRKEEIAPAVAAMLAEIPASRGYVVNLGHGILPATPVENVLEFVTAVKNTPLCST